MFAPSLLRITCDELLLFEILLKQVSLCEYILILSCNTRASIATCLYKIGQADMVIVDGLSVRWMTITIILTMAITINIILTKKIDQHCDFGAILRSCDVFLATSGQPLQHVVKPRGTRSHWTPAELCKFLILQHWSKHLQHVAQSRHTRSQWTPALAILSMKAG